MMKIQFRKGYFQWNGEYLGLQIYSRIAPRIVDALDQITEGLEIRKITKKKLYIHVQQRGKRFTFWNTTCSEVKQFHHFIPNKFNIVFLFKRQQTFERKRRKLSSKWPSFNELRDNTITCFRTKKRKNQSEKFEH